jgi:uncharacterized protein
VILYRSAELTPGTGRTVHGIVVPYGQTAEVSDGGVPYPEKFVFGALTRSIAERGNKIRLFTGHDTRRLPIGKATELREAGDGLHAAFEIADTSDGRDALELVRSGVVDGFSIGFRSIRHRMEGNTVVRTEAALMEVSLVGLPTYPGALVAGVRSQQTYPVIGHTVAAARLRLLRLHP